MVTDEQAILNRRLASAATPPAVPQGASLRAQPAPQGVPQRAQPVAQPAPGPDIRAQLGQPAASVPQRASGIGDIQNRPNLAESLRVGNPPASAPERPLYNRPALAESLRVGAPPASVPQRVGATPLPQQVNPVTAGDTASRVGQRVANISGQPYRDPRSVFNRPIDLKPAADLAGKVGGAAKTVGKALIPSGRALAGTGAVLGGIAEASRAGYDMLTPGMNDVDKTARVAEGIGRFGLGAAGAVKGAAAGGALGAMTGPLSPVLAPAGALAGGIAGGVAGAYAPEMLNSAVNKVSGFFGGPDQNQLPSQKAEGLRALNGMPPPPGQAAAPVAKQALADTGAGAGRGNVNPALVKPEQMGTPATTGSAGGTRAPKAKGAAAPKSAAQAPATPQGIGANPMDGVTFTTLGVNNGDGTSTAKAYMADGRVLEGAEASKIIRASEAYQAANPTPASPVQIIRGPSGSIVDANGTERLIGDISKSTAVPELGFSEIATQDYEALAANGGVGRLTEAMAQGLVDRSAPEQAKIRGALEEQALQNQGSAANAAISAGPGYARVGEDRRQFNQGREDQLKGIGGKVDSNLYTVVPGGQEVVDVGGFPTTITRPARVFNNRTSQFVDPDTGIPAVGNYEAGKVYTDANGNKATWDGKKFVATK